MSAFQKLGTDRLSQNIARAVTNPPGALTTGDITKGDQVTVTFTNTDSAQSPVKSRRVGAILISSDITGRDYQGHYIENNRLVVNYSGTVPVGSCVFWVF